MRPSAACGGGICFSIRVSQIGIQPSNAKRPGRNSSGPSRFKLEEFSDRNLGENNRQREQRQRLDKYQAQDPGRADISRCARISRNAFACCRADASLPQRAPERRNRHADTRGDPKQAVILSACSRRLRLRECRRREQNRRGHRSQHHPQLVHYCLLMFAARRWFPDTVPPGSR